MTADTCNVYVFKRQPEINNAKMIAVVIQVALVPSSLGEELENEYAWAELAGILRASTRTAKAEFFLDDVLEDEPVADWLLPNTQVGQ